MTHLQASLETWACDHVGSIGHPEWHGGSSLTSRDTECVTSAALPSSTRMWRMERQRLGGRGYWGSRDGRATSTRSVNTLCRVACCTHWQWGERKHGVRAGDPERRLRPMSGAAVAAQPWHGHGWLLGPQGWHTKRGARLGSEKEIISDARSRDSSLWSRSSIVQSSSMGLSAKSSPKYLLTSSCVTGNCRSSLLRNCMNN
eukprot:GHVR01034155.1.p2 GENE.GHVR01034155.1~~GHVR01034155.1.p2  ORF type:complete len:201 (+),score=25.94 GHVR01034155.1:2032-2634(+)